MFALMQTNLQIKFSTGQMFVVQMNVDLIRDVELLRQFRLIKRDKDIVERTGFSKRLVSQYLSGSRQPSKEFTEKFYEVFKNEI